MPKLYPVVSDREAVVGLLEHAIEASGARVIYSSFRSEKVAPMYLGAEDDSGRRYGLLVYPFTTTRRETRNRPSGERRTQIRFGDPTRNRDEFNPLATDTAGVDVTLVLAVDPELDFIVGLDPLIYHDLPMGISIYYNDSHVEAAEEYGWAAWERKKSGGKRRESWEGLETLIGFHPERLLDYVRFEAKASALRLSPELRHTLADSFAQPASEPHGLEKFFGVSSDTILDIIEDNFRLGIAVRGGVAEHHLGHLLSADPTIIHSTPLDEDGQPDFLIELADGRELRIECKTASKNRYANDDHKVEVQKTRDSGAGRKYTFEQFDIVAACLFSSTGIWEYRFRWTTDLLPWDQDATRLKAVHRVDDTWAKSIEELLEQPPTDSALQP